MHFIGVSIDSLRTISVGTQLLVLLPCNLNISDGRLPMHARFLWVKAQTNRSHPCEGKHWKCSTQTRKFLRIFCNLKNMLTEVVFTDKLNQLAL